MSLIFDKNLEKLIVEIKTNGKLEKFDCEFSVCENPVCTCGTICLNLTRLPINGYVNASLDSLKIDINIYERALSYNDEIEFSEEELELAEQVLESLSDDDFNLLIGIHFDLKNRISEQASTDSIEAEFDYEKVEYDGLMSFYNDILPYGYRFVITIDNCRYNIRDQYCLLPKCSCTDTYLVIESENPLEKQEEGFCDISINYKKKQWKILETSHGFLNLGVIKSAIEQQIPDIYQQFFKRHEKLKSIYHHCKKRDYAAKTELVTRPDDSFSKVGRNDPCPCGSGKKHKKCCLKK